MSNFYLSDVFEDVSEEGQRARAKFGDQTDSSDERWLAILAEEVGEAATEVLRAGNPGLDALLRRSAATGISLEAEDTDPLIRLRKEVIQVAAVAMRWAQSIDHRREWFAPGIEDVSATADADAGWTDWPIRMIPEVEP